MTPLAQDALPADPAALREMLLRIGAERDGFAAERDRLATQRDTLASERDRIAAERDELACERDRLAAERERLATQLEQADQLAQALRLQLRMRLQQAFGRRSERLDDTQMSLFVDRLEEARRGIDAQADAELDADRTEVASHRRSRGGRPRGTFPDHLPRRTVVVDLPEDQKRCACGCMKVHFATTAREVLEYRPATFTVVEHQRLVYHCVQCNQVSAPPAVGATLPIPKAPFDAGVLAAAVVGKYCDHLPLYRLEGIFSRSGVEISRQTMCGWLEPLADLLMPLCRRLRKAVLASAVVQTDDTPVTMLDPGLGRSVKGRIWSYLGAPVRDHRARRFAVFEFTPSREGRWPQRWLSGYEGYLQADAFPGYAPIHAQGRIVEVACWAHARRKFFEARPIEKRLCDLVLARMREVYAVEDAVRELAPDERLAARLARSRPIADEIVGLLEEAQDLHRPKSPVRQAIEYMLSRKASFLRPWEDGVLEIDNNACERSLRAVAVGRKNWLFAGSRLGGERAAVFMTVLCSARLHEAEPWAYLANVLDRLARRRADGDESDASLDPLMPDRWAAEHPDNRLALDR